VYCAEVEAVLFEHPDIAEVAVVGMVEPTLGERVCAVVVARPERAPDLAAVRAFAAGRLAAFKCPEALLLVDALPKTATEKVAKQVLREQLTAVGDDVERTW
jgi:non-ribosomal peptide synthetase component E (peptide arylation enzyme)